MNHYDTELENVRKMIICVVIMLCVGLVKFYCTVNYEIKGHASEL